MNKFSIQTIVIIWFTYKISNLALDLHTYIHAMADEAHSKYVPVCDLIPPHNASCNIYLEYNGLGSE